MNNQPVTAEGVALTAESILRRSRILNEEPEKPLFQVYDFGDRAVLSFDPALLSGRQANYVMGKTFTHMLSTSLQGRLVVPTNTRGFFLQVGYEVPPPPLSADSEWADFGSQPNPTCVPVGVTKRDPNKWMSLSRMDSALVGGSRGMGKSVLLHGWIQALLRGGEAGLVLWDGKGGAEFARYAGGKVRLMEDPTRDLEALLKLKEKRETAMRKVGARDLHAYNAMREHGAITPVVVLIDEAAHLPEEAHPALQDLVQRGRASGFHVILATQFPKADDIPTAITSQLTTRFAFFCPEVWQSTAILGRSGAEKLPKVKGRMLVKEGESVYEAQVFLTEIPSTPPARHARSARHARAAKQPEAPTFDAEARRIAEKTGVAVEKVDAVLRAAREQIDAGGEIANHAAIEKAAFGYAGGTAFRKTQAVLKLAGLLPEEG